MNIGCYCKPFPKARSTLYPDYPEMWICSTCGGINPIQVALMTRYCVECLARFSVPDARTTRCKDCEPHEPQNSWSSQIKKFRKLRGIAQ